MGRLIDESELIDILQGSEDLLDFQKDECINCIKACDTAYDPDKVVVELEKLADKANDKILEGGEPQLYYDGYEDGMRTAVEIVKGGGVDD